MQLQPQIMHTDVRVEALQKAVIRSLINVGEQQRTRAHTHTHAVYLIKVESCRMWACWEFLTAGSVDDIAQLSVFPLAEVVLFHASGGFGCLHLRTPVVRST